MTTPGIFDLPEMSLDYDLRLPKLGRGQTDVHRQLDPWVQPELRFPVGMRDVHVNPLFLPREEEETKRSIPDDRRRHPRPL
mgnify:FL=1